MKLDINQAYVEFVVLSPKLFKVGTFLLRVPLNDSLLSSLKMKIKFVVFCLSIALSQRLDFLRILMQVEKCLKPKKLAYVQKPSAYANSVVLYAFCCCSSIDLKEAFITHSLLPYAHRGLSLLYA